MLTFDPHPARFFAPALAPPLLLPLARRLELLGEAGADFALVEPFDAALAALPPEAFVDQVLVARCGWARGGRLRLQLRARKRAGTAAMPDRPRARARLRGHGGARR